MLDYDEKSKRIYGDGDELGFDYGWDKNNDSWVEWEFETPFT